MNLSIITMYVNANTDNSHIIFTHIFCWNCPSVVSYNIPSFRKKNLIHPVNEIFHMLKCSSCIMSRVIHKMLVKTHLHIYLITEIIVIFIMIPTCTYSTVESKCLWLNLHIKLCLQCFRITALCNNRIIVSQKILYSNIFALVSAY